MALDVVQDTIIKATESRLEREDVNLESSTANVIGGDMELIPEMPEIEEEEEEKARIGEPLLEEITDTSATGYDTQRSSFDQQLDGRDSVSTTSSRRDSRLSRAISNSSRHSSQESRVTSITPSLLRHSSVREYYADESDMDDTSLFSESYLHRDDMPSSSSSPDNFRRSIHRQNSFRARSDSISSVRSQHLASASESQPTSYSGGAIGPKDLASAASTNSRLASLRHDPLGISCPPPATTILLLSPRQLLLLHLYL